MENFDTRLWNLDIRSNWITNIHEKIRVHVVEKNSKFNRGKHSWDKNDLYL
jgi:hypothetical protein